MDKILHDPRDPKLLMGHAGFCPSAVAHSDLGALRFCLFTAFKAGLARKKGFVKSRAAWDTCELYFAWLPDRERNKLNIGALILE